MFKKYSFIFCNSIVYNLIYVQALPNHNARHVRNFIISLSWLSSLHLLTSSPFQVLSWKLFGLVRGKCISILCPLSPHTMSWCPASKLTESFRSSVTSVYYLFVWPHLTLPSRFPLIFCWVLPPGTSDGDRISSLGSWHVPDTLVSFICISPLPASRPFFTQLGRNLFFI